MKQLFDIHAESPEIYTQNTLYPLLAFPPSQNYIDFYKTLQGKKCTSSSVAIIY